MPLHEAREGGLFYHRGRGGPQRKTVAAAAGASPGLLAWAMRFGQIERMGDVVTPAPPPPQTTRGEGISCLTTFAWPIRW